MISAREFPLCGSVAARQLITAPADLGVTLRFSSADTLVATFYTLLVPSFLFD